MSGRAAVEPPYSLTRDRFCERWRREWNSTLHQSSHSFATRVHGFATETKTLARNPASYAGYQKLDVGGQNFRTGRQQATNLLSNQHLKFQGKSAFLKTKHEAPVGNCSKTKRRFCNRHIYLVPYCFSGFSQYGYCGRKHDMARLKCRVKTCFHISNWPWICCDAYTN